MAQTGKPILVYCRGFLLECYFINLYILAKHFPLLCDKCVWEFAECSCYLQRAERTGEILPPAASHTPLSPRFLKHKKVYVLKNRHLRVKPNHIKLFTF